MTNEEIRITIAESVGFTEIDTDIIGPGAGTGTDWTGVKHGVRNQLPNYPCDLNAMRDAETTIPRGMAATYGYKIIDELESDCPESKRGFEFVDAFPWHASAIQRARAFVKLINKWKS